MTTVWKSVQSKAELVATLCHRLRYTSRKTRYGDTLWDKLACVPVQKSELLDDTVHHVVGQVLFSYNGSLSFSPLLLHSRLLARGIRIDGFPLFSLHGFLCRLCRCSEKGRRKKITYTSEFYQQKADCDFSASSRLCVPATRIFLCTVIIE